MSDTIMQLHSAFESFATSQRQVAFNSRGQRRRHRDSDMADTSVQSPYRYLNMNQYQVKQEHCEQFLHSHQMVNSSVPTEATLLHSPAYINMNSEHDRHNNSDYDSCCYGEFPVNRMSYEHYQKYIEANYINCAETHRNIATPDKCVQDAIRQTIDGVFSVYTPLPKCTRDPVRRSLEQTTFCKDYVTGSEACPVYRKVPSGSHTYCDGISSTSPLSSDSGRDSFSGDEPYSVCSSVGNLSLVEEFDSDAASSIFTDDESICSTCSCDECKEDYEIMNQRVHNNFYEPYPSEYETLNDADNTYESIGSIDVLDSPVPPPLPPRNYPRRRHTNANNCMLDLKGCRCKDVYHKENKVKPTDIIDIGKQHMYTVSDILESVQKLSLDITEDEDVELCKMKLDAVDVQPYVELEDKCNSSFSGSYSQRKHHDLNRNHQECYTKNLPRSISPPLYQSIDGEIFV